MTEMTLTEARTELTALWEDNVEWFELCGAIPDEAFAVMPPWLAAALRRMLEDANSFTQSRYGQQERRIAKLEALCRARS